MILRTIREWLYFSASCCVGNCTELFLDFSQLPCLDVGPRFYHLCWFELRSRMNRVAKVSTDMKLRVVWSGEICELLFISMTDLPNGVNKNTFAFLLK